MRSIKPLRELQRPMHDARETIIAAATGAFAESGFHGTTTREIAQRAGVAQGLLHHHYGSKEDLWNAVGARISDDFLAYVSQALSAPVAIEESVPRALRAYMRYWKEHPHAFRLNLWRVLEGPKGERKVRAEAISQRAAPLFQQAQQAGFIRPDMPPGLAMIVAGSLVQFWLHSQTEIADVLAVNGDPMPDDEAFVGYVLKLVQAPSGPPGRSTARRKSK